MKSLPRVAKLWETRSSLTTPLLIAITLVGLILRIIALRKTSWLYDEIVYVNWLADWFSRHGVQYVFQWQHTLFPPRSPFFADPPLVPLLYGAAISALSSFKLPDLTVARSVSAALGTATIPLSYAVARNWFGRSASLMSSFYIATSPTLVVLSGTAYLDGAALFFGLAAICYFLKTRMNSLAGWLGTAA